MERPWLILRRVLDVGPPGLHAVAEEHAVVIQAEADANAQAQQHAGVGEAEEHAAVVDAAAAAQAQHAAVAEAEQDAQAQAGVGGDAAIEAQVQLEQSVMNVNTDLNESQEAHAAMDEFAPDFIITVARPPRVSSLFAGLRSHPDAQSPDIYPYIIAAGRFCLLVHFAMAPSYGTNFNQGPAQSHLVVVRHFLWGGGDGADIAACAVPVPDRPVDDLADMPALRNIESVGLVSYQEIGHYQIAELIVTMGAAQAAVVYFTDIGVWTENLLDRPLGMDPHRVWVPHGTVTINSTVFWYDLSWGLISCNLAQPPLLRVLNFHRLPPGRVLLRAGAAALPDLHCRRCIAVSENLVRYVEIILNPDDGHEAATVNMWYRNVEDNQWRWGTNYSERFGDIWEHESYAQTGLPHNPPMLVGVSPVDSSVVYFSLNQRLFGVNVPEHTVVDCEQYQPLYRPGPPDEPVTSRYLITWNLDADGAPNVGHQPDEPSDHADSSASGPLDEGELDNETLLE